MVLESHSQQFEQVLPSSILVDLKARGPHEVHRSKSKRRLTSGETNSFWRANFGPSTTLYHLAHAYQGVRLLDDHPRKALFHRNIALPLLRPRVACSANYRKKPHGESPSIFQNYIIITLAVSSRGRTAMTRIIPERRPHSRNYYRHVVMGKGSPWNTPTKFYLLKGEC